MYHALALEDLLDLVNIAGCYRAALTPAQQTQVDCWRERIEAMRGWLQAMSHPDGGISFFNDAAFGIAPDNAELDAYAARLGLAPLVATRSGCCLLPDSGYIRLAGDEAVILLDVAPIGPEYLPGHAHADTLSLEMSVEGRRAIVNSGTSVYSDGPERQRQRSTAVHNTVTINGENSSEVWSGFRAARRARPDGLSVNEQNGTWAVVCGHDGYRWLAGRPRHRRLWKFGGGRLTVKDTVAGPHQRAVATFHFHPDLTPVMSSDSMSGSLVSNGRTILKWRVGKGNAKVEPSTWHPEFGKSLPSCKLSVILDGGESEVEFFLASTKYL